MPPLNKFSDINALWAGLVVEELLRCGVGHFCVAPGSRSAPLAIAVAENPKAQSTVHFDERGLGFYALGMVSGDGKPAVVITTSGTAVANLLPSIIEAGKKKLPLIILTADRPPELRATGANQTIDQIKIFGDYVRFFYDFPCPTTEIPAPMILTTVDQAVFRAQGEVPGPVHLNCMFREPLAPLKVAQDLSKYLKPIQKWLNQDFPFTQYAKPEIQVSPENLNYAAGILNSAKSGIIVAGKIGGEEDQKLALHLAEKLGWPVFADITSGLRLGQQNPLIIHRFDALLKSDILKKIKSPDCVLHLGGRLTSNHWYKVIPQINPSDYLSVLKHPLRNDPTHTVTFRVQSSVKNFCASISPSLTQKNLSLFTKTLIRADHLCETIIDKKFQSKGQTLHEPVLARLVTDLIPDNSGLFIANSMPIREVNDFASKTGSPVKITANRGASGIDGNIASAVGFAKSLNKPCTTIIGDLAFLHDLNSLSLVSEISTPFVIVIINNNGGAIFSYLPVSGIEKGFTKFFTTPHNMNFKSAAALFNIDYVRVNTMPGFKKAYSAGFQAPRPVIIEIPTQTRHAQTFRSEVQNKIASKLKNY